MVVLLAEESWGGVGACFGLIRTLPGANSVRFNERQGIVCRTAK
ncbi:hypothetical protein CEB3_c06790 [Peptococcaceae bacterium CEB3]|nr:hypothetical protein CEB3_c06790 [Peptococcaceae bacterium CEB3]